MEEKTEVKSRGDHYLVWFDTEYTGLELESAYLLQVSVLVTDRSLHRVLPCEWDVRLAVQLPQEATVSPWVEENLPELLTLCRSSQALSLDEADCMLAHYIDTAVGPPAEREAWRPILSGNSVHADWWLARKYLPSFSHRLHYRHLDVTTLKIEWQARFPNQEFDKENPANIRQYFPEASLGDTGARHDAYYDIQASIAELAFYRRHLFNPGDFGDGPDKSQS